MKIHTTVCTALIIVITITQVSGHYHRDDTPGAHGRALVELRMDNYQELLGSYDVVVVHACFAFTSNCREQLRVLEDAYQKITEVLEVRDPHPKSVTGRGGSDVLAMATVCMHHGKDVYEVLELQELGVAGLDVAVFREGEFDSVIPHHADHSLEGILAWLATLLDPPVAVLDSEVGYNLAALQDYVADPARSLLVLGVFSGDGDNDGSLWSSLHHSHTPGQPTSPEEAFFHAASVMRHEAAFAVIRTPPPRVLRWLRESCESLTDEHVIAPDQDDGESSWIEDAGWSEGSGCDGSVPILRMYRNHHGHDHDHADYAGDPADVESVRAFFEAHTHPLWDFVDAHNHFHYSHMGMPFVQVFVDASDKDMVADATKLFKPMAYKYRHNLRFGYVDAETHGVHAMNIGLVSLDVLPAVSIEDVAAGRHYVLSLPHGTPLFSDAGEAAMRKLAADVVAGRAKPTIVSQPTPPRSEMRNPVIPVVGNTFESVVLDPNRDVLILFYSEYDGFSRAYLHDWENIGTVFARAPNVVVAKMDFDKNDIVGPNHGNRLVFHPPHVFLYPRHNKENPHSLRGSERISHVSHIHQAPTFEQTLQFFFNYTSLTSNELELSSIERAYTRFVEDPEFSLSFPPGWEVVDGGHGHDEL